MATTFDPALSTPKDRVRQRIGQTDLPNAKIADETITAYLTSGLSELAAAKKLCLDLAAMHAAIGDTHLDGQMSRNGQMYDHYIALAAQIGLEIGVAAGSGTASSGIIVGGIGDTRGPIDPCDPYL